jgi:Zn-dependent M16 (insulinase) family peptidase
MPETELKMGLKLHGFEVRDITPLEELNATLYQLRHHGSGARLVHLATADDNNLFAVGFHTPPPDSTGVAHILEHTVLCGSRNYPVRDPFFSMLKRSLNTFMNALTSSDWTLYPFSSMNGKDFYNLMDIYLDAAFYPLLRERDFRQEGHRLEFADPADPSSSLEFKGVVYNEMKGAMADPSSLISRRLNQALFPTTAYGKNSGGEPSDIPNLTWEDLRNFHATYYHPGNAFFFTSGNFPLEKHLEKIESRVLSRFKPCEAAGGIGDEVRFAEPKRVTETFPVDPGEPVEKKSMVQVAWLTCPIADNFERTSLSLLSTLLLGNPAAPLYQALMESRLGQNLAPSTGYHDDYRETYFAAGLQGTDPEAAEEIEKLVLSVLEKSARDGFNLERIEAAMQQLEFAHREVTGDQYPYALILLMRLIGPWIHNDDPVSPLQLSHDLDRIRRELEAGPFFENLIRKHLLGNPHRVTLLLKPDPERKGREERETAQKLAKIREKLTEEDRERIVREARDLQAAQEAEEDLSCLPTLELADIPAEERPVPSKPSTVEGISLRWFDQPTNGIGYFLAHLDAENLPEDLRPFVPLFCAALTHMGAAGHTWQEMAERIAAATGGIRASTAILEDPGKLDGFGAVVEIRGKALIRNQGRMFEIFSDLFGAPEFTDLDRLQTVVNQVKTNLDNSIPGSGHSYAARGAASDLTPGARLRDQWAGLAQVRFVREIAALKPEDLAGTAEKLKAIGKILLRRRGLRCALTAEKAAFPVIEAALAPFLKEFPSGEGTGAAAVVSFTPAPGRKGWTASLPVAYVTRVFRAVPFSHPDAAALMVLARLLRAGFLHREIREKGGAYGGMATFDPEAGLFSLLSYRDPQLTRTLNVYREAAEWAAAGSFGGEEIKEAILAVFSDLDRPLSPGGKGTREFAYLRQGLTPEMRRRLREGVLAADGEKLADVARRYLLEGWQKSAVGVIAGEDALRKADRELGGGWLAIEKI